MCPPTNSKSKLAATSKSSFKKPEPTKEGTQQQKVMRSGGFAKYRRDIEIGILLLSVIYGITYSQAPPVAAKYCSNGEEEDTPATLPCVRPDIVAFQVVCGFSMMYMGILGARNWYFDSYKSATTKTPEDRLFGYWEGANHQNVAIFCYQVFDFAISCTIPEHQEPIFLIHHLFAGLTAYISLEYHCMTYYSVFYGGCSEISSIFLSWMNIDTMFPQYADTLQPFALVCKGLFVLTFLYYRIYGWTAVGIPLWKDTLHVLRTGSAETHRPGKSFLFKTFLALNVIFGLLQWYWLMEIIQRVQKMLS